MKQYIRKADIILFAVLVCLGLALTAALALSEADGASDAQVVIKSGGKLFAKVVEQAEEGFLLRYTSIPAGYEAWLKAESAKAE